METTSGYNVIDEKITQLLAFEQLAPHEEVIRKATGQLLEQCRNNSDPLCAIRALDAAVIAAGDLNLTVEPVTAVMLMSLAGSSVFPKEKIVADYGPVVAELISGLQKIDRLDTKKQNSNAENYIKLLLTLSDDIRVILARLAHRLSDVRHLPEYAPDRQMLICGEVSALYVPIAHRIGLYRIKNELEDRVMQFSDPDTYLMIEQKLRETQKGRDQYASDFIKPITERLKENGFDCEIKNRIKSIPSIWRKMQAQKVEFERVYDLFAIRIILRNTIENEKSDCWKVYSLVTDIYTPNPRRLRDWISFPKATGYESLHTTVIGPEGRWVEVQIRTHRMDEIAEKSFAAHWKYKSGGNTKSPTELFATIREMLEKPVQSTQERSASLEKKALYTDEIFIFTPKGDLKKLKAGYTVLDFAFEIHTGIGSTCTGAIVNGKMVPLKHVLQNGDTVKIITSRTQKPSHNWLEFVKSPRVIARIKHALKMETYKDADQGKEILKNKVTQLGFEFTDIVINRLIRYFEAENNIELYQRFGEGKLDPMKIKKALAEPEQAPVSPAVPDETILPEKFPELTEGKQDYIVIDAHLNSVKFQFAKCCNPIIGDKIFAFVSVTQGIRIHKTNCSNARQLVTRYPYRILEARWKAVEPEKAFTANLAVTGDYHDDLVNNLSKFLTNDLKVGLRSTRLQMNPGNTYTWEIGILVTGKMDLDEIIRRLRRMKEVTDVTKIAGS